jgi:hypothetical protein
MTIIHARKKTGVKAIPKGKVRHISVRPLDNGGFTVNSDHEVKPKGGKGGKGMEQGMGMLGPSSESHEAGFANPADTRSHIGQLIGAGAPGAPAAPSEPAAPETPAPGGAPAGDDDD